MTKKQLEQLLPKLQQKMTIEDMKQEISEYLETAGYADYYERVMKNKTEEETLEMYVEIFASEDGEPDWYTEWHEGYMRE